MIFLQAHLSLNGLLRVRDLVITGLPDGQLSLKVLAESALHLGGGHRGQQRILVARLL